MNLRRFPDAHAGVRPARDAPRRRSMRGLLLLALSLVGGSLGALEPVTEPAPADVFIALPGDATLDFKAVFLGLDGTKLFDARRVVLGSREPDPSYKERLVETLIAGGFVGLRREQPDWLYYLGVSEVRRDQWNAVMRWWAERQGREPPAPDPSQLPKTGLTPAEIQLFIEALNTWMLSEQRETLPRLRNALAFARLPTEAEWAFAARGGIEVLVSNPDAFDRPHPYDDLLSDHEWHRDNTGNRVQACASEHIQPNPIGLYDMLGNVEELTGSLFGPEYQQGRFGQLVMRGGNFSTAPERISAAMRTEYAPHDMQGELRRPDKVGFRLALSTPISAIGGGPGDLDNAVDAYFSTRALTRPALVGESAPTLQAREDQMASLQERIALLSADKERLTAALNAAQSTDRARSAPESSPPPAAEPQIGMDTDPSRAAQSLAGEPVGSQGKGSRLISDAGDPAKLQQLGRTQHPDVAGAKKQLGQGAAAPGGADLARTAGDRAQQAQEMWLLERKGSASDTAPRTADLRLQLQQAERRNQELVRRLEHRSRELADANRRQLLQDHEIDKNVSRVRAVEKRYLEALMRQASANAYLGYRSLRKAEIRLALPGRKPTDPAHLQLVEEADQMVRDYWHWAVEIATSTTPELFPEVKRELAGWLQAREQPDSPGLQRKALDLLERHVGDVRAGHYHRPEDLVAEFTQQPELSK